MSAPVAAAKPEFELLTYVTIAVVGMAGGVVVMWLSLRRPSP